ncbi:WD domain, G-beta repeat [Popillia japonica]|uniref:GATOR2 complex protein WDR24 n=1 Tax=Popillia japonica TaxID=7064 RepID=A0AAW1MYM0_POPJA
MATFNVAQDGPVNALALNRDNTQIAIGGRNVFKVYSIEEDSFKEICNLRASKSNLNLSFSCNDVAWSSTDDHYLATAATNGHVCVWNLTKMGKAMQEQDYQEHKRTVNKVNFHASEPNKLISGSQDGTMRYFDIRCKNAVAIFYSNTESVRDVQFSPHIPHTFAAVSENGSVQIWDIRKSDKCQQQFTAHSGPVFACDWHPESPWLATASRDKTIKVWDLSNKPTLEYTIHTIASIGHIKWRPQRKYHIASCALVVDCSINIWDVRRPYIPFAQFNEHKDVASGVVWRGEPQVFLSSGRDCTLYQHSFSDATRPANKANPQGVSINNKGDVIYTYRISTNNISTKPTGLIRKSSNTLSNDQFHQATSAMLLFQTMLYQDTNCFYALATNYMLSGRSFSEMCEHNAAVAKDFGKSNVCVIWRIIKTMYSEEFYEPTINHSYGEKYCFKMQGMNFPNDYSNDDQRSKVGENCVQKLNAGDDSGNLDTDIIDHVPAFCNFSSYNNFKFGLPKGDFSFGENELDIELDALSIDFRNSLQNSQHLGQQQQDWTLPNEAFNLRHEILDRSPPPENFSSHYSPDINDECQQPLSQFEDQVPNLVSISKPLEKVHWDPSNIVVDALKYHATMGDIQTAACVLTVLGERRKSLKTLDESTQEHWLLGYIELLNRYKLWNIATEIIKLSWLPSVSQLNQQSTRINTNCSQCAKPLQRIGWLCDRCHSSEYALCSICHQVVKGLYAWCQGCSHGGHLEHMQEWITKHKVCPTEFSTTITNNKILCSAKFTKFYNLNRF